MRWDEVIGHVSPRNFSEDELIELLSRKICVITGTRAEYGLLRLGHARHQG